MKRFIPLIVIVLTAAMLFSTGCKSDSEDTTGPTTPAAEDWVGSWLSAGANVAPLLVNLFNYDSVRVVMNDDQTLTLSTHVAGQAWADLDGTYTVTKSASGDVHSIEISYPAFDQGGIIQVVADTLKLEVVQTNPDIGATPRTPATGFGSDVTLGTINIQTYIREN